MYFPVWHRLQQRITSPDGEQGGVFRCSTLRTPQCDNLAYHSRTFPLREAQPGGIAIFIQAHCSDECAVALTLKAALAIALPNFHHGIEPLLFLFLTQVGKRASIRGIVCLLHRLPLNPRESSVPSTSADRPPEEQRTCTKHYRDSASVPGCMHAETAVSRWLVVC